MVAVNSVVPATDAPLDRTSRFLHLGMAVFGVWAWWIGEAADDYKRADHFWYTQHLWVGIVFTVFLLARVLWGLIGPANARFVNWVPWTRARFRLVLEDLGMLLRFKVPDRATHMGLAGLVQALGILLFLWVGLSGLALSVLITPGVKTVGAVHDFQEWHEATNVLIWIYLILHVGAVLLHALTGKQVWKKMLFLE